MKGKGKIDKSESKRVFVPIVAVIGSKESGKTRTVEKLAREFVKKGYRVGCIKHIPHKDFSIDSEGKDTWRFARAGSNVIMSVAPSEVAIIRKGKTEGHSIDDLVENLEDEVDIVFVEGFRTLVKDRADIPKVLTSKNETEAMEAIKDCKNVVAIVGLHGKKEIAGIPCMDEDELLGIAEKKVAPLLKVGATMRRGARVKIDGKLLPMNPFVQDILKKTVFGFISSLKGVSLKGDESLTVLIKHCEGKK